MGKAYGASSTGDEKSMDDLNSGVRKYLKRKADGGFNYMYAFKKPNGEIDYLLKCGD